MHAETWPLKRLAQPWPHESGWTPPSPMRPAGCDKPAGHRGRGGCSFSATSFFTGTGGAVCDAQVSRAATPPLAPVGATLCLEPEGGAAVAAAAGRRCRSADMQWRRTCVAACTTAGRCAAVIEHAGALELATRHAWWVWNSGLPSSAVLRGPATPARDRAPRDSALPPIPRLRGAEPLGQLLPDTQGWSTAAAQDASRHCSC